MATSTVSCWGCYCSQGWHHSLSQASYRGVSTKRNDLNTTAAQKQTITLRTDPPMYLIVVQARSPHSPRAIFCSTPQHNPYGERKRKHTVALACSCSSHSSASLPVRARPLAVYLQDSVRVPQTLHTLNPKPKRSISSTRLRRVYGLHRDLCKACKGAIKVLPGLCKICTQSPYRIIEPS